MWSHNKYQLIIYLAPKVNLTDRIESQSKLEYGPWILSFCST